MNIHFRHHSPEVTEKIIAQSEKKIRGLSRLMVEHTYAAQIYVDIERESGSHTQANDQWKASIQMTIVGDQYHVQANGKTPLKAIESSIKDLKRTLQDAKEKREGVSRKEGAFFKRLQRGFR